MKDNRVSNKELLVARDYKRCRKIYRQIWYISKNKESDRNTSRKFDSKWSTRKAIDIFNSRLYYKVAISSWERCNSGSLQ